MIVPSPTDKTDHLHSPELNCVRGKWKLVEHREDYEHSSARFYVKNKSDGFVPVHYEELSYACLH